MTEQSRPIFVACTCHTAHHLLRFTEEPDCDDMVNVDFVSTRNGSIWHRIKWAMKHVFGREDLVLADVIVKRADLLRALEEGR